MFANFVSAIAIEVLALETVSSLLKEPSLGTAMDTTIANYTLPAVCHVLCTLVATGIPAGINVTNSDPAQPQHKPVALPDGYVAHPDVGFAYKVYDQNVTWIQAKSRCVQEGAQLALIDSAKKLEYVKRQQHSRDASVGIIRMYDDKMWVAVSTGLPVSSLPWHSGEPSGDSDCAVVNFNENGLINYMCDNNSFNFICELPILEKNAVAAN